MVNAAAKLEEICAHSVIGLTLYLGEELNLFNALAAVATEEQPATAKMVADKAGLRERYVKEWLCVATCSDLVEVDQSGEYFWIRKNDLEVLSGPNPSHYLKTLQLILHFSGMFEKIKNVFHKNGPLGTDYNDYKNLQKTIDVYSRGKFGNHFMSDFIPMIGLKEKLENEQLEVLDIGCGTGFHASLCAENFPNCTITGIDNCKEAITAAQKKENKYKNLKFYEMNAQKLPDEWTNRFDWITLFDAVHDQTRPDLCLKEIYRVLKINGTLTVIDQDSTSNVYLDKIDETKGGEKAAFSYAWSVFSCLPCGSNAPDALCLGAMWGRERALQLLKDCGWTDVKTLPLPFCKENVVYVCKKQ